MTVTPELVESLNGQLAAELLPNGRLGKPARYLRGSQDMPYMPRGAKAEFEHLAKRSITNWMPLVSDTFAKSLFVDGYRAPNEADNLVSWGFWQANGLDARQTIAHRGSLEYGTSYVLVLPGKDSRHPLIRPLSPLTTMAWYKDEMDEFPEYLLRRLPSKLDATAVVEIYDDSSVYTFWRPSGSSNWVEKTVIPHGLSMTPAVRFRDRIDGEAFGVIRPLITMQDRVNEVVFSTLIAMQYASFRQRWATGLAVPIIEDEEDSNFGKPLEPFESAVNRLWVSDSAETKFGDFAQTDISGHINLYGTTVKSLAAIAQINPNILTGDLVNVSAEGLAQLQDTTQRKLTEYEVLFGEAWEDVFRLANIAAGIEADTATAQVRWRETEARSLSQTVDALGKMSTMLSVPVEALWEKIPGVTDTDVERWVSLRSQNPLDTLTNEIARQTAPGTSVA